MVKEKALNPGVSFSFTSTDPLSSRARFKSRTLENIVALIGIFLGQVAFLSWVSSLVFYSFLPMLAVDAVAFVVCYYFHLLWDKRPIRLCCDGCDAMILSNTPWVCGVCGNENLDTDDFSFLYQCPNCGTSPKSYTCHHCKEPIFFSEDRDQTNPAKRLVSQAPKAKRRAKEVEKVGHAYEDRKQGIEFVKLDLIEAQLNERLEAIKKRIAGESKQSALEVKRESLSSHMDSRMAVEEAARQQKAVNADECKNDHTARRRRDAAVEDWKHRQLAEGR